MRNLFLAVVLAAASVWGGEAYLGTVYVYDGGTSNNAITTTPVAGRDFDGGITGSYSDGGTDGGGTTRYISAGFTIPVQAKLSLQEQNRDSFVGTGIPACAGTCLRLGAGQLLPTSTGAQVPVTVTSAQTNLLSDGGINYVVTQYNGGLVSVAPTDGGCCASLDVYLRNGNE